MHVVAPAQAISDDFEMQLALGGKDSLVQLGINLIEKGGVFVMQRRKAGCDLILFSLGAALERGMNVRSRILDLWQRQRFARAAKSVSGVRILEFHDSADVAGIELGNARSCLAVENVNLADLFGNTPI